MKKTKLGQQLIASLNEAVDYGRGKKKLRASQIEIPEPAKHWKKEQIARLRKEQFKVSQPTFASLLSVKTSTVRAWEQGLKTPSGAASRLLELAELEPQVFRRLAKEQR
jgi:putative transcriptional regulator